MKVLLLGSGGRESALADSLARSKSVGELFAAPGNPGMAAVAETFSVNADSVDEVGTLARKIEPDLVVVGPEAPLVAGVGDAMREEGFKVFGPDAAAAQIEGSKAYAKKLMDRAGIPTARWSLFTTTDDAVAFMDDLGPPYVVKADGLAAGKGVLVTEDRAEAVDAIRDRLERGVFGAAGDSVVIEEFLDGPEASLIAFVDGKTIVPCEVAQDYKRALDEDEGPNTGGMGSYSPVPQCAPELVAQITTNIMQPMARATADAGAPFVGALYAGLALTSNGPRVVEFNARFGDPETQALLPRLESDLGDTMLAASSGDLAGTKLRWSSDVCVCIVLASEGYPGEYETGFEITGLDAAAALEGVSIFHAGTAERNGSIVTSGGRVLNVSALGSSFAKARTRAYDAAERIHFEGKHMRSDIALRAEESERNVG